MNTNILAIMISEGSKFLGNFIRNRPIHIDMSQRRGLPPPQPYPTHQAEPDLEAELEASLPVKRLRGPRPPAPAPAAIDLALKTVDNRQVATPEVMTAEITDESPNIPKSQKITTGCVPCAIGHLGTCSGLLNEAVRFSGDGLDSEEVVDRVGMCLDELNTMERVDLRPEMTSTLADWEKELVDDVLKASRSTRHSLEGMDNQAALEKAAATVQTLRTRIWREWIKRRMANFTPEDTAAIQERVAARMAELLEAEDGDSFTEEE